MENKLKLADRNGEQAKSADRNGEQAKSADRNGEQAKSADRNGEQAKSADRCRGQIVLDKDLFGHNHHSNSTRTSVVR
jgi:hypothetical protein